MKDTIKLIVKTPSLIFIYIFFKVKWIKGKDKEEFFLVKRYWVWYLIIPIYLLLYFLKAIYEMFTEIHSYNIHWIGGEKHKLTFKQKLLYGHRLFN